jgi:hypothetical protein
MRTWTINYTGPIGGNYTFDVFVNTTNTALNYTAGNSTADVYIYNLTGGGEPPVDTCTPTAGQNWNINAADNCVVNQKDYSVANITLYGAGSLTVRNSNITSTGCAVVPSAGSSIYLVREPPVVWAGSCS